jgi:succinate dehydrogenase / fumarate reductase membrane anchor subunit
MNSDKSFRSALGRVKGLGSAKEGAAEWWGVKLTSLALIPLSLWLVQGLVSLIGTDQAGVVAYVKNPANAVFLILFIGFGLHHSAHGVQVVMEDYIHAHWKKVALLLLNRLLHLAAAAIAFFSILLIALKA